jgi:hypothetical protein
LACETGVEPSLVSRARIYQTPVILIRVPEAPSPTDKLTKLLQENTELTEQVAALTPQIHGLLTTKPQR